MLPELLQVIEEIPDTTVHFNVVTVKSVENVIFMMLPDIKKFPKVNWMSPASH
jgi:hypothetical protein